MILAASVGALLLLGASDLAPTNVLVFSKTAGFRHDSIPVARKAIVDVSLSQGWSCTFTEDSTWFLPEILRGYSVVVFLMTTGDVLNEEQQKAFEGYIESGGGYVGVHAAADTEYEWKWYGDLVGAYFKTHPAIQTASVRLEDEKHPTTSFLPKEWKRTDEWYTYRDNPRSRVHVLANLDESTYTGGGMGDHPITWCKEVGKGRSWYTGMGHTQESYLDSLFMRMITEAIRWAGKVK